MDSNLVVQYSVTPVIAQSWNIFKTFKLQKFGFNPIEIKIKFLKLVELSWFSINLHSNMILKFLMNFSN